MKRQGNQAAVTDGRAPRRRSSSLRLNHSKHGLNRTARVSLESDIRVEINHLAQRSQFILENELLPRMMRVPKCVERRDLGDVQILDRDLPGFERQSPAVLDPRGPRPILGAACNDGFPPIPFDWR